MGLLFVALASAAPVSVEAALEQSSTLSSEDARHFGDGALAEIASAVGTVEKLLALARKEGDTEAVECLSRKLVAMKALHGVAAQSSAAIATSAHPDGELRKVAVALSRTRDFLAEAHACVTDAEAKPGVARVSLTGDPAEGPALADLTDVGPEDELPCIEVVWVGADPPQGSPSGFYEDPGSRTTRYCF